MGLYLKLLTNELLCLSRNLKYTSGRKFFDPKQAEVFPRDDFDYCIKPNVFDFVIKAKRVEDSVYKMNRIEV